MSEFDSAYGRAFDVVVIGSGFGGAAVACRMAQAGLDAPQPRNAGRGYGYAGEPVGPRPR